jgi:hypothetical protein
LASSDSGMPKMRIDAVWYGVAPASSRRTSWVSRACGHIAWSSRGGPGSTITVGPAWVGTTNPGAVPAGSIGVAPSGTIACFRFASRRASASKRNRRANPARMSAIRCSISGSSTSSRPANRATASAVRSSAVGPRPPLVTIRSTPTSVRNRSADSSSGTRSPTHTMCVTSTPCSPRRSAIHGPLRSEIRPASTSVPVTTMPPRTASPVTGTSAPGSRSP